MLPCDYFSKVRHFIIEFLRHERKRMEEDSAAPKRFSEFTGLFDKFVLALAAGTSLYHLAFILGVFQRAGLFIHGATHYAISLGLILFLVFLLYPAKVRQPRNKVPWYDVLLGVGVLASCSYHVFFPDLVVEHIMSVSLETTTIETILAIILFIGLMEGVRRTIGIAMPILAAFFVLYVFISGHLPGLFSARPIDLSQAVRGFYLGNSGIFSVAVQVNAMIIFPFIIFSSLLQISGAGKFLVNLALSLTGRFRGGPAKVAVVSSAFFGTLSGSTVASVATTGSITIPLMKQIGYRPAFAGAVEAVASNGGQIMPPVMGVVAFMMAEITGTPYFAVCRAAILPAILYYIALFVAVDLEAARVDLKGLPREYRPHLSKVMKEGWYYTLPIAFLVFSLVVLMLPAETAVIYSIAAVLLASMFRRESRVGPKRLMRGLADGAKTILAIGPACGLVGVILGAMNVSGIGILMTSALVNFAGSSKAILLVLAAILSFIMGMGMGAIIIYMTLAALVAPALVGMGVQPLAAHFFLFYFGIVSLITPPVAIGAFVAAGIAGSRAWETGWLATRLGIATFIIPFMFVYNPVLLLEGSLWEIIVAVLAGAIGSALLAVAVIGYLFKPLNLIRRIVVIVGSLLLIYPGLLTDAIGLGLATLVLSPQFRWRYISV